MKKPAELDPLVHRPALNFAKGVCGKHLERVREGANLVLIAPDLVEAFPDSESVNEALRVEECRGADESLMDSDGIDL